MVGGVLGVYCHHSYAHASDSPDERLPAMMKGADAAFLVVCDALQLKTQARPVYPFGKSWWGYGSDSDDSSNKDEFLDPMSIFGETTTVSKEHLAKGKDIWVGARFRNVDAEESLGYDEDEEDILRCAEGYDNVKGIHWLNKPKFRELELAYPTVL